MLYSMVLVRNIPEIIKGLDFPNIAAVCAQKAMRV